jgi:hypothetical protein
VVDVLGAAATHVELLTHNPLNAVTGGIWRVEAGDRRAVCKVLTDGTRHEGPHWWAASTDPTHWNWWRREADVYAEDLARWLRPHGVDAPHLRHLDDRGDGVIVLWLDWEDGASGADLGIDGLAAFARALGRAQAHLSDDGDAAEVRQRTPWLSQGFLRNYSESKPDVGPLLADDSVWANPLVAEHLGHLREDLTHLHRQRDELFAVAGRCPRTLCHLDVWPANVTRRPDGCHVLFDWSFTGDGALGEDIANLIPDSVFDLLYPADRLGDLAEAVESAYIAGVRSAGWRGDDRWIRLGIRAAAVKYHWLVGSLLRDVSDGPRKVYGGRLVPAEELYHARATGLALLCRWADEARALA